MSPKLSNKYLKRQTEVGEDYGTVCRLCLSKTSLKLNIFFEEGKDRGIQGKILNCLSLIVEEDDNMSKFVCCSCVDKLDDFQNFQDMCHESENFLNVCVLTAENKVRRLGFEKPFEHSSYQGSQDAVDVAMLDTVLPSIDASANCESGTPSPSVWKPASTWHEDKSHVENETPVTFATMNNGFPSASMDTRQFTECMEGPSAFRDLKEGECVSGSSLMQFEVKDASQRVLSGENVPIREDLFSHIHEQYGDNVPVEDSDVVLISSDGEDTMNIKAEFGQAEGKAVDADERYVPRGKYRSSKTTKDLPVNSCTAIFMNAKNSNSVMLHKTTHTNNDSGQKMRCNECGRCFTCKRYLVRHVKLHSGEKPFQCKFCSKKFARKDTCDLHSLIHSNVKPYSCSLCDRGFNRRTSLTKHEITCTKRNII